MIDVLSTSLTEINLYDLTSSLHFNTHPPKTHSLRKRDTKKMSIEGTFCAELHCLLDALALLPLGFHLCGRGFVLFDKKSHFIEFTHAG